MAGYKRRKRKELHDVLTEEKASPGKLQASAAEIDHLEHHGAAEALRDDTERVDQIFKYVEKRREIQDLVENMDEIVANVADKLMKAYEDGAIPGIDV